MREVEAANRSIGEHYAVFGQCDANLFKMKPFVQVEITDWSGMDG